MTSKKWIGGGVLLSLLATFISWWLIDNTIATDLGRLGLSQAAIDTIKYELYMIIAPQIASVLGGILAGVGIMKRR